MHMHGHSLAVRDQSLMSCNLRSANGKGVFGNRQLIYTWNGISLAAAAAVFHGCFAF